MKGWVDLVGWLHTEIKCRLQESNPDMSPIPVLTGLDVEQLRWYDQRRYHYATPPTIYILCMFVWYGTKVVAMHLIDRFALCSRSCARLECSWSWDVNALYLCCWYHNAFRPVLPSLCKHCISVPLPGAGTQNKQLSYCRGTCDVLRHGK